MKLTQKQIQHLYWRAGFGIHPCLVNTLKDWTQDKILDRLFEASAKYSPLTMDFSSMDVDKDDFTKLEMKEFRKEKRNLKLETNLIWLKEMSVTKAALREKMALFFHDHFAVNENNPRATLQLVNIVREHALGNFKTMLTEVSKAPAMLAYLNAKQNKKASPNENFARELMELFTLGRDTIYTEKDIREAARAFAGWSFDRDGVFKIQKINVDYGDKFFLGQAGNFDGDDILRILLDQKQTAKYITSKLIDFLIARPISEQELDRLTNIFFDSNYEISAVLRAIFTSEVFNSDESIGRRVKSPTELIVGLTRQFKINFKNPRALIQIQRSLNQVLCYPPNVAGWPNGVEWIDSSTLLYRMKLASIVLNQGEIELDESGFTDEEINAILQKEGNKNQGSFNRSIDAYPDWNFFNSDIKYVQNDLNSFFIQPKLSRAAEQTISSSTQTALKAKVIELCSLPEYQLC